MGACPRYIRPVRCTTLPLLAALVLASACRAQQREPRTTQDEGTLPSNDTLQLAEYVVGAFEDSKGGLWFGTINNGAAHVEDGKLNLIDTAYGLPPNGGHGIAEARDGLLWFAGHDGVWVYNPEISGPVQVIHTSEGRVRNDRHGNVWVSTMGKLYRHESASRFEEFAVPVPSELPAAFTIRPNTLVFQLEDSKGNLWFSTDGHGAFRYDGKDFTQYTKKDGLCSNTPWDIIEDRAGRIWFACVQAFEPQETGDGGLCVLEKDGRFTTFADTPGLHHNDIYTLYLDRDGAVWSSASHTGVYRINGDGVTLFTSTDRPDLNGNFGLQAMMQDRHGTLWCGFSGGLFRFDGSVFRNVTRGGPWK